MIIPENTVIFINIFVVLFYIIMIYLGYKRGLVYGLISLLYNLAAIVLSWLVSPVLAVEFPIVNLSNTTDPLSPLYTLVNVDPFINTVIYFIIIFVLSQVLFTFVMLLSKGVNKIPVLGSFNRVLGLLMGFINSTLILILLSLLFVLPVFSNGNEIKDKTLFKYIESGTTAVLNYGADHLDPNMFADSTGFDAEAVRNELKLWIESQKNGQ
ncbi:MAG: CvpA family protein [Erysipelotrichaceae bacterium]|nr:CvpA family protein [Erysipelotrichaceae bacterium]